MKYLILIILSINLFSCAQEDRTINPKTIAKAEGGVDVGNMSSSAAVPNTGVAVTITDGWSVQVVSSTLIITDPISSSIKARRYNEVVLKSSPQIELKNHLETINPELIYELFESNGLLGVRAEVVISNTEKKSFIYLISETDEIIEMISDFKSSKGIETGEKIIASARLKFYGEAVKDASLQTITIANGWNYSFFGNCDDVSVENCPGVKISNDGEFLYLNSNQGRVVELGIADELSFESIKIEGDYLEVPRTRIPLTEIYSALDSKESKSDKIKAKVGRMYLIRTMNWPFEDLIVKVKIIQSVPFDFTQIVYQKLIHVRPEVLKKRLDSSKKISSEN